MQAERDRKRYKEYERCSPSRDLVGHAFEAQLQMEVLYGRDDAPLLVARE